MDALQASAIALAGVAAGGINAVVGSGSLITFPTLLAFGYPPLLANITNNVGMVPGGVSGTWGYRRELRGQARRVTVLVPMSALGGLAGATLLLVLPPEAFRMIVPVLLTLALVLVVLQPRIQRRLAERRVVRRARPSAGTGSAMGGVALAGIYGGYFGGAQGVLLVGLLGTVLPDPLQHVNALKNLLATTVNGVAAIVFVVTAGDQVDWVVAALIAAGSAVGGVAGSSMGRRMPQGVLRAVVVLVGATAVISLVLG